MFVVAPERSLEEVIGEAAFAELLAGQGKTLFQLCNTLSGRAPDAWKKRHFYELHSEADELESFLDDYGARHNRTYVLARELVASIRWFALAGFSVSHLRGRFGSYGLATRFNEDEERAARSSLTTVHEFVHSSLMALVTELRSNAEALGVLWPAEGYAGGDLKRDLAPRHRLPHNVGEEVLIDEEQRIAEVASKYLAACEMFDELGIRELHDDVQRRERLARFCTEEQARVYEATVHNLQSTYDTHLKNTVVEGKDERLPRLRGHLSAALHLLETVTFLTHFVERHDSGVRGEPAEARIVALIDRSQVQSVILNHLLLWADRFIQRGRPLVDELLPTYTNLQELVLEVPDDLTLHARPASLVVNIVGRYGTPVELEVAGKKCNASSILELLITVGANPEARRYVFRGDVNPLRDIGLLFENNLGESGLDDLPDELGYLRKN